MDQRKEFRGGGSARERSRALATEMESKYGNDLAHIRANKPKRSVKFEVDSEQKGKSEPEKEADDPPLPDILPFIFWTLLTAILVLICIYGFASFLPLGGFSVAAVAFNHAIMSLLINFHLAAPGAVMPWAIPFSIGLLAGMCALGTGYMACRSLYHFVRDGILFIKDEVKTDEKLKQRISELDHKTKTRQLSAEPEEEEDYCYRLWAKISCSEEEEAYHPVRDAQMRG